MVELMQSIPICREASISELEDIVNILVELELEEENKRDCVREKWLKIILDNPVIKLCDTSPSFGWVLECNNEIVGFFGSICRRSIVDSKCIIVAVASSWAVRKQFRAYTKLLSNAFFKQKNVDLFLVTSAIKPTMRIFQSFSGRSLPQLDYNKLNFSVLNNRRFIVSFLLKKKFKRVAAGFLSYLLYPLTLMLFRIKCPPLSLLHRNNITVENYKLDSVGDDYDDLWENKIKNSSLLYSFRKTADLRWILNISNIYNKTVLLSYRSNNQLIGYVLVLKQYVDKINLKRAKIVDLFVINDKPEIINALIAAAYIEAKNAGDDVIECHGFHGQIKNLIAKVLPFVRLYPNFPYYFKAISKDLDFKLQNDSSWYACSFDGDSFC